MGKRTKGKRFRPNVTPSTLTVFVVLSLGFCVAVVIWGMVQAQNGVDSSSIVDSALRVFGTELGICGVLTLYKRWIELQDRRAEERRKRREEGMKNHGRKKENYDSESADC